MTPQLLDMDTPQKIVAAVVLLGAGYFFRHMLSTGQEVKPVKSFKNINDYIGTVWQNPVDHSTLYFKDERTVVYHMFEYNIYSTYPVELEKDSGEYIFNSDIPAIAIRQVGTLVNVPLTYSKGKNNYHFLLDIPTNEGWQLEERPEILELAK